MARSASNFSFGYFDALTPSEQQKATEFFDSSSLKDVGIDVPPSGVFDISGEELGSLIDTAFGPDAPDLGGLLGLDSTQPLGGLGAGGGGWTFITAPEDVSWDTANQATRVDIFGTNNPPVVAGSRGMRDLTLSNALVEGFVRNVNVEAKVRALEDLMNYVLNGADGFVSVPVYQVWANKKPYAGPDGYYIIKDVKVKETMRDLTGNSTRAYVDVSFMQVPAYQVNSGRDQASQAITGAGQVLQQRNDAIEKQGNQKVQGAPNKGGTPATDPNSKPNQQSGTPPPDKKATDPPKGYQGSGGLGEFQLF